MNVTAQLNIGAEDCSASENTTIVVLSSQETGTTGYGLTLSSWGNSGQGSGGSGYLGTHWPYKSGCSVPFPNCNITIDSITAAGITGSAGASTTFTYYQTEVSSSQPCLYFLSQSNEIVFNATMSYYYNSAVGPITFQSTSDPYWSGSSLPPVILPFTLQTGDRVSLYNTSSLGWDERFEYVIKSVRQTGSLNNITSSVLLAELDRPVNLALLTSGSSVPTESITGAEFKACRYIVWKHVPDETNVMLRYNPKDQSLVENGILFPQYIDPIVRDNAGNVVKALKQQNLI